VANHFSRFLRPASGADKSVALAALLAVLGPAAARAQSSQDAAAFTARPPVVDGDVDAVWERAPVFPIRHYIVSQPSSPADLSATFRALWDRNNLYLLVEVRDDKRVNDSTQRYDDDGVSVYLDIGNKKLNAFGATDYQYYFSYGENQAVENRHNAHHKGVVFATRDTPQGYRMEMRLSWATLKAVPPPLLARPATRLGLDVHVNDDDNGGTRDHKIAWHAVADNSYESPRRFGTITLTPPRDAAEAADAATPAVVPNAPGATTTPGGGGGVLAAPIATDSEAPPSPVPAWPGVGTDAPLLAAAGVAALIVGALGVRSLLASRQARSGGPAVAAPNAGRAAPAPSPFLPAPAPPPDETMPLAGPAPPPAAAPAPRPAVASEPSMALRPSLEGASPAPTISRRVPPAASSWPWTGENASPSPAGGAAGTSGEARLVGVSPAVLGIVVPLGEGMPDTDNGEASAEVEAAVFTDPANGGAAAGEAASGDQVRILVRPDGRFILRPLERGDGMKTFLNDRLVRGEQPLQTGDEIQIGAARFRFEA